MLLNCFKYKNVCKVYFVQFLDLASLCRKAVKPGRLGQEPVLLTAATGAPPPHSSLSLLGGYKIDLLEIYTQTSTKSILVSAIPNIDFKLTFLDFERYGFKRRRLAILKDTVDVDLH